MTRKLTDAERSTQLIEIQSWEEMPAFKDEEEEAEWWATHSLGAGILDAPDAADFDDMLPPARRSTPVSIRFDAGTLGRLKSLAHRRHKGYQTMVKEFVAERLYEEEKREGIIGDSRAS